jgi:pilus assembly protein CpaC
MSLNHIAFRVGLYQLLAFCCLAVPGLAQVPQAPAGNSLTFKVQAAAERMELTVNTSRIVEMPFKVPRMYVGNPETVKATPLSPTQVQLTALKAGVTQVNFWDEEDKITTVDVIIYGDSRELEMLLKSEFPDAHLKIRPLASSVYLSGFVSKAEQVGQIVRMAEDFYPKVVNNITVGGVQQILLNVKVMEVSRTKLRSMGIDWSSINSNFFLTQRAGDVISNIDTQTQLPVVLAQGAGKDTIRFGVLKGGDSFYGFLEMLRQNDLAKLLAEPKLITVSGRPAAFNVGGQIPIPVAQSLGTVTVQYRDFGTQIDFVPLVLGNGNIRLEVRPDVTEVDPSLRDATTGVPGFRRRFADTAVEMRAGQTMAVAGLIYYRTDTSSKGIPFLADLPWVGSVFRRTRENMNEVELVITVTPEFVEAMDPEEVPPCGPGMSTTNPSDSELYGRGYIEVPKCCTDGSCATCRQRGPVRQSNGSIQPSSWQPNGMSYGNGPPAEQVTPAPNYAPVVPSQQGEAYDPQYQTRTRVPAQPVRTNVSQSAPIVTSSSANNSRVTGGTNPKSPANRSNQNSEPSLIGPLGYDRLK